MGWGIVMKATGMKLKVAWRKVLRRVRVLLMNIYRLKVYKYMCIRTYVAKFGTYDRSTVRRNVHTTQLNSDTYVLDWFAAHRSAEVVYSSQSVLCSRVRRYVHTCCFEGFVVESRGAYARR